MRERHNVYVIELDIEVLYEAKFKKANPDYVTGRLQNRSESETIRHLLARQLLRTELSHRQVSVLDE